MIPVELTTVSWPMRKSHTSSLWEKIGILLLHFRSAGVKATVIVIMTVKMVSIAFNVIDSKQLMDAAEANMILPGPTTVSKVLVPIPGPLQGHTPGLLLGSLQGRPPDLLQILLLASLEGQLPDPPQGLLLASLQGQLPDQPQDQIHTHIQLYNMLEMVSTGIVKSKS